MVSRKEAIEISENTTHGYSFNNYAPGAWKAACIALAKRGFDAKQIEWIVLSKHMRWAGDMSNKPYGHVTSMDLLRYIDKEAITPQNLDMEQVAITIKQLNKNLLRIREKERKMKGSLEFWWKVSSDGYPSRLPEILNEEAVEHICKCFKEGYTSGQLLTTIDDVEYTGFWEFKQE